METGLLAGRGNRADYVLGTDIQAFGALEVVRFRAREALGQPFEVEITALRRRDAGPIDLAALVGKPATFRIASERRWRSIHGIVVEAQELERTRSIHLYRVVLMPEAYRMTQRVRYRTFVDQTLRQVLVALLENRTHEHPGGYGGLVCAAGAPPEPATHPAFETFEPARAEYRFAVSDPERLDDPRLRPYVVQYGESDLDLFHRLLEEEGLTYFFEHGDGTSVLTIVDRPGHVSPFAREERCALRTDPRGTGVADRETIRSLSLAARMVWGSTTAREWDPARAQAPLVGLAIDDVPAGGGSSAAADPHLYAHDLFPSRDGQIGEPCVVPATLAVERRAAERSRRLGRSTVRTIEPGLKVVVGDDGAIYDDQTIVITSVTTYATQLEPEGTVLDAEPWGLAGRGHDGPTFENEFTALPDSVPFRPALRTARPRIHGVQTAVVSADEVSGDPPEIHKNDQNCVRVRFPWDERIEKGRPSSCWIRVSQGWAGAGYGQLFIPRVGQEVLVAYLGGDPERPLVVGRVYNAIQPAPYDKPTISTIKTKSSPDSDGYNEIRFDDEAGKEEVFLHAQRNLIEVVEASHATSVGGDQSNSVGGNQSNSVTGERNHSVKGNETNTLSSNRLTNVTGNDVHSVGGELDTYVKAKEVHVVQGLRETTIGATDTLTVGALRSTSVAMDHLEVTATRVVNVGGPHTMSSNTVHKLDAPRFVAIGGGAEVMLAAGMAQITSGAGASITLAGNVVVIDAGTIVIKSKGMTTLNAGGSTSIVASGPIDAAASVIRLNG